MNTKGNWEIDGSRPWRSILELNGMTEELKNYPKAPTRQRSAEKWCVFFVFLIAGLSLALVL